MKKLITASFITALCLVGLDVSAQTDTLFYTGALQTITVPPCVTSMTVDMAGGQGGSVANLTAAPHTATGGLGGRVTATIPVVGGSVLQVNVGGRGLSDSATLSCIVATGGFNGGGTGYGGYNSYNYNAGGGGGATDIRIAPYAFANVLAVAGGGGGAGCTGCTGGGVDGGPGGGLTGGNGFGGACASGTDYGFGGTQVKGGDSGTHWGKGTSGTFGMGGTAGMGGVTCGGGGGGGGGYYGGGGASLAGGGGGSSYTVPGATGVIHTQGYQAGVGYVIITFNNTDSLPVISGPASVCQNSTVQYTCKAIAGASTYTWSVPSGANVISGQGKDTASITFGSVSGTVSVHTDLCAGDSSAISVTVNLLPVVSLSASKDTICVNNTKDSLMVSPLGGILSGTGVSGSNFDATIAGAGAHKVVYSYTDSNGCSSSDSIVINVNVCAGISELVSLDNAIKLYPNPFSNSVNINVGVDGPVTLSLFNMLGENMGTWNVNKGNTTIDTKGIPTGVYSLEIKTKSGILNKKLVKVN